MQNINAQGWKQLLSKNPSFQAYGNNAIGLLALALRFNIDDISYAGSESLVDGSNDKKNDFIYIDEENKIAIIIQAYFSKVTKHIAPANKASDLNTAILWLLSSNDSELPEGIKQHALKLRNGIKEGNIKKIQVWYVHNCTESENVKRELNIVKLGLNNLIKSLFKENDISTDVLEVGSSTLSEWYLQSFSPIYVSEDVNFTCTSGFEVNSENWDSFVTSISARELYFLYQKHKSSLFSANIRDYLGDRDTNSNINSGIKSSIRKSPNEFWAYNNGLTVITNSFNFDKEENKLTLNGVSIVNGAQTTGAIGNLTNPPKHETQILVRFIRVKNSSKSLVGNIVRYNNSQNKVDASDFRSNDSIQKRLITEINLIDKNTKYLGGRRGGDASAIKRHKNCIPSFTVSQALCAFHGDPINSYKNKSQIWNDDHIYSKLFNEKTTGGHILFVYSLYKKIEKTKLDLNEAATEKKLMSTDQAKLSFFRANGAILVYIYAISQIIEIIVQKPISDNFTLSFGNKSLEQCIKNWEPIVEDTLPLVKCIHKYISQGLNDKNISQGVDEFKQVFEVVFNSKTNKENRFTRDLRFK